MTRRRVSLACLVLALAMATTIGAPATFAAAGEEGSWELGVYGGMGFLDNYDASPLAYAPADDVLYGIRAGRFFTPNWSAELSYQKLETDTEFPAPTTNQPFNMRGVRFNVLYNFLEGAAFRPFLTVGAGSETARSGAQDEDDLGVNVGGGVRWYLADWIGLRADARAVYANGNEGNPVDGGQLNLEATAGLLFSLGGAPPADTDGDGVRDRRDDCPDTPKGATVDERGCPSDADGDGVFNGIDQCPDTAKGCPVDAKGCPIDTDGDGVIDCQDRCAATPTGCAIDAQGCPKDADGDGVCDGIDKCAGTPKGCKVDAQGCPADADGDGVCDGVDACEKTPKGCQVDAKGCPKDEDADGVCDGLDKCAGTPAGRKVDVKGCELVFDQRGTLVLEGVTFEYDSAKLTPESMLVLDRVATSLGEWKEIRVEVAGHTDAKGSDAYNLTLSQRRAEAVRDYLVSKGVDASRVEAKGYGETEPLADNKTDEGRARNRRVELKKK